MSNAHADTLLVEEVALLDFHPAPDDFLGEVVQGLSEPDKRLPCKFFYDERGSQLFDQICELPEYYPTRTELAIMQASVDEMAAAIGPGAMLVEYGSGSSLKTRILLDHLEDLVAYVPIDISRDHLLKTAHDLNETYPELAVLPICADYSGDYELPELPRPARRTVAYFPGSTLGNFLPEAAAAFLRRVAATVGATGGLLLGYDLKKDRATLERAYNDSQGITAGFNKNLLLRINRELDGNFDLGGFRHRAIYNAEAGRIEMYLVSERQQIVKIGNREFSFQTGEAIHTENSHKYSRLDITDLAALAGLEARHHWTDAEKRFAVSFFEVVGGS